MSETYIITRLNKVEICGTVGIDNWMHFARTRKEAKWAQRTLTLDDLRGVQDAQEKDSVHVSGLESKMEQDDFSAQDLNSHLDDMEATFVQAHAEDLAALEEDYSCWENQFAIG